MEKEYKASKELKEFIKIHEDLINANKWKEILLEAANTKDLLIAELIYFFVVVELDETKYKQMTIGLSDELNRLIKNNEILDSVLKRIK